MRRAIAGLGRSLVTLGLLILLFVGYQLWGTGYFTAQAQADLENEFEAAQRAYATTTTVADDPVVVPSQPTTTTTTFAPLPVPNQGDGVGYIEIPKIDLGKFIVEGTSRDDLKKGPGHYPGTPMPGQIGNAAIAGHRTTYGAPFNRLDELAVGDEIVVTLANGAKYTYQVRETPFAVSPNQTEVVANTSDAQLTLTTCHPKYSARQRLIVKADLVVEQSAEPVDPATLPAPARPRTSEPVNLDEGLDGDEKSLGPAWGWGAIAAVVGLAWWWCFRRWRHPATWVLGVGPFLAVLFAFYVYLERALPAGY